MEKRTKLIVASLAVGVAVATAGFAVAEWKEHRRGGHYGWHAERVADWLEREVDLTREQHERIAALGDRMRDRMRDHHRSMSARVAAAIRSPSLDKQEAAELVDMRRGGHDAMMGAMAETLVDLHAILTPEQRGKLAERVEERGVFGHRWGWGRGWGRGHRDRHHRGWGWGHGHWDDDDDDYRGRRRDYDDD